MPSQPKNRQEAKSTYVRLTIGQTIEICKMARARGSRPDMHALVEWAARAFDLPRPPSEWSLYNILRNEAKFPV
ncbi:hypothetical protein F444_15075 [Phytophthora nicotianae P1976]|uniref:Uncharacterized protein n=1 Tax=Phytophthora nicotianae P1976 TaxID=1317066 RepID=A0A080ZN70_PHYNI|nr:hypothetical protein F444_15075 [Phytophthora nicotianae P1976]